MYHPGPHLYVINGSPHDTLPLKRHWGQGQGESERLIGQLERREEAISGDSVQLAGRCKHDVGFYDNVDKAGGSADGTVGAVDGADIRGVQHTGCVQDVVGFCDDGDKTGGAADGAAGSVDGVDIRAVQLADSYQHIVGAYDDGEKSKRCMRRWGQVRCLRRWAQVRGISK